MQDIKLKDEIKPHSRDRLKCTASDDSGRHRGYLIKLNGNTESHTELCICRANVSDVTTICDLGRQRISVLSCFTNVGILPWPERSSIRLAIAIYRHIL